MRAFRIAIVASLVCIASAAFAEQDSRAPIDAQQAARLSGIVKQLKNKQLSPQQLARLMQMAEARGVDAKRVTQQLKVSQGKPTQLPEDFSPEDLLRRMKAAMGGSDVAARSQLKKIDAKTLQQLIEKHQAADAKQRRAAKSKQSKPATSRSTSKRTPAKKTHSSNRSARKR